MPNLDFAAEDRDLPVFADEQPGIERIRQLVTMCSRARFLRMTHRGTNQQAASHDFEEVTAINFERVKQSRK